MAGLADKPSAIAAVINALLAHLRAEIPSIQTAIPNFPSAAEKLVYPAISLQARNPQYNPFSPYVISKGAASGEAGDRTALVRRAIGTYDFSFQLDLWTAYRPQRDSLVEEILAAFSKVETHHGVELILAGYFGEIAHCSLDGLQLPNTEEGSQRNEWRALWTVTASVRTVKEQSERIFETIENNLETPEFIDPVSDPEPTSTF